MKEKITDRREPRFHPNIIVPDVPEGRELHKFHGQPVLLTAREDSEPMFGNSPYTKRQARELADLDIKRQIEESTRGLNPTDPNTQALAEAISERPKPNAYRNGVLLKQGITSEIGQES